MRIPLIEGIPMPGGRLLVSLGAALLFVIACSETPTEPGTDVLGVSTSAAVRQAKVDVCHAGDTGWQLINVAQPALAAHLGHGDGQPGGAVPGMAGYIFDVSCAPELGPILVRSPATMALFRNVGEGTPVGKFLDISNGGGGTLNWTVSDDQTWLSVSQTSGSSTGEIDQVIVIATAAGLSAGTYNGTVTVTDPAAVGSPQTTEVTFLVSPEIIPPPVCSFGGVQGPNPNFSFTYSASDGTPPYIFFGLVDGNPVIEAETQEFTHGVSSEYFFGSPPFFHRWTYRFTDAEGEIAECYSPTPEDVSD